MRWNEKENKNPWREAFALFPIQIEDTRIWLERYLYKNKESVYGHVLPIYKYHLYEGCAERVGYPCDCIRHK